MEVYAEKNKAGSFCQSSTPNDVGERMVEPVLESGRNITAENWFTDEKTTIVRLVCQENSKHKGVMFFISI